MPDDKYRTTIILEPEYERLIAKAAVAKETKPQSFIRGAVVAAVAAALKSEVVNTSDAPQNPDANYLADGIESLNTIHKVSPVAAKAISAAIIAIAKEFDSVRPIPRPRRGGKITAKLDELEAEIESTERET